ncbi:biotin-dependent carboxylase-like uncharacterized protein [Streptomyces tendae]|uniref:5-oxoprolinase subunit C family protein n=1 Tax=Streptomyces tendae TaxID=1932 RepID=UPI003834A75F
MIELLRTGMLATVQDSGRFGYAHLGVPRSGAADQTSYRLANRLVGNPESAACLEFTLGQGAIRFHRAVGFAVTGAPSSVRLGGRHVPMGRWNHAVAGDVLELGLPDYGLRTYVAFSGGLTVPQVLGSRSTDTLSGLGPAPLQAGNLLTVGGEYTTPPPGPDVVVTPVPGDSPVVLAYRPGPRDDWFPSHTLTRFESARWEVTAQSDRVGARLTGPQLISAGDGLPSEGMVLGSIEVPPSGQPIVFLADHPATGGYPVIGVVETEDVAVLAQTRPGSHVRFVRKRASLLRKRTTA